MVNAPTNLSVTEVSNGFELSWSVNDNKSTGNISIERSTDNGNTFSRVISGIPKTTETFTDSTNFDADSPIYRIVRVTDNDEAVSSEVEFTEPAISEDVPIEETLESTVTDDGIELTWRSDETDGEFIVYRDTDSGTTGGDYTQIDTVPAFTFNQYLDSSVSFGERYHYRTEFSGSLVSATDNPALTSVNTVFNTPSENVVNATEEVFGDGSDGSITDNSTNRTGQTLQTTNYTLTGGSTLDVNGTVIIHAQDYIEINGTIDANSNESGGNGAGSSSGRGRSGQNGPDGRYVGGNGSGGSGGGGNGNNGSFACGGGGGGQGGFSFADDGGSGGSGTGSTDSIPVHGGSVSPDTYLGDNTDWDEFFNHPSDPAGGGAGGGAGGEAEQGRRGEAGGDGGRGGGLVILIAPEIRGSGIVDVSGENGQSGDRGVGSGGNESGAGGGGGGGCGGLIYAVYEYSFNLNTDISGGAGGNGGGTDSNGHDGGDGADGKNGEVYSITVN